MSQDQAQRLIIVALVVLGALGLSLIGAVAIIQTVLREPLNLPEALVSLTSVIITALAGIAGFFGHLQATAAARQDFVGLVGDVSTTANATIGSAITNSSAKPTSSPSDPSPPAVTPSGPPIGAP